MGIFAVITDLLFPPKCIFCRRILRGGATGACPDCLQSLTGSVTEKSGTWFTRCVVPMTYEGAVREALIRFKFEDQPGSATVFGRILADCIRQELAGQYDMITWVPVSARRQSQRGYDQAMLIAMAAALELDDVALETLQKTTDNPAQSSIQDAAQRRTNVRGTYCVPDPEIISGKRILLIDDIITTGATLDEASRTLLEAGASQVLCAALAAPVLESEKT